MDIEEAFYKQVYESSVRFSRSFNQLVKESGFREILPTARLCESLSIVSEVPVTKTQQLQSLKREARKSTGTKATRHSFLEEQDKASSWSLESRALKSDDLSLNSSFFSLSTVESEEPMEKVVTGKNVPKFKVLRSTERKQLQIKQKKTSKKGEKISQVRKRGGLAEQLFSGAFAGIISRTAVAPLDLIRVLRKNLFFPLNSHIFGLFSNL